MSTFSIFLNLCSEVEMSVFTLCLVGVLCQRALGEGLLVVRKLENVQTGQNNRPKLACTIAECGEM